MNPVTPVDLTAWADVLACPIDHGKLTQRSDGAWQCESCSFTAPLVEVNGRLVNDFRARDCAQTVNVTFQLPVAPLDRYEIARTRFRAPDLAKQADHAVKLSTKLDKGSQYYLRELLAQEGAHLRILDLGCGNGDNRRFLRELGFQNVLAVDWSNRAADILVDAHRLPFAAKQFQVVTSTAVFEHLYNPFLAMAEIGRISSDRAWFVGGASFWEAWHGSSYFHLTPDGWHVLLAQNGYDLTDLWVGWGIIPALFSHVLTPGYLRAFGYKLQELIEGVYRLAGGEMRVRKFQLRASGSYMVYATRR